MQFKYASAAWNDIKNSQGWFGKLALLALLNFIPIFGQIVALGYAYGWARDIAWGIHAPLPAKLFGNEDGKLYSRGFFILVVAFVVMLIPFLVTSIASGLMLPDFDDLLEYGYYDANPIATLLSVPLQILGALLFVAVYPFVGVGAMRTAIYDRISAGLQLKKVWSMIRYDTNGVLRILGMAILISLAIGIITSIVFTIIFSVMVFMSAGALINIEYFDNPFDFFRSIGPALGVGGFLSLIASYFATIGSMFTLLMVARASGYWTRQFNVAQWRGQEDLMPFEVAQAQAAAQQQAYAAQAQYAQAQAQYAQAQGQAINVQNAQAQAAYAQAQAAAQQPQQSQQEAQATVQQTVSTDVAPTTPETQVVPTGTASATTDTPLQQQPEVRQPELVTPEAPTDAAPTTPEAPADADTPPSA